MTMSPFNEAQELNAFLCQKALLMSTDTKEHHAIRTKMRQLYLKAAEQGSVPGKAYAALCFAYCIGGPQDLAQHKIFVHEAADAGDVIALGMRAENYWFGENGFPIDLEKCEADALRAYNAGAWLGATVYTWVLRKHAALTQNLLLNEKANKICEETLPALMKEALEGNSIAQDWLAWRYYNGEGVTKDSITSATWFRLSADNGLAWAQCWLGIRYLEGDGVPQNTHAAQHWLKKAADQGIQDAAERLALLNNAL